MNKPLKRALTVSASVLMLLGVTASVQNTYISTNASAKRITRHSKKHIRHMTKRDKQSNRHMKRRTVRRHRTYKPARHKRSVNNKAYKDGKEDGLHIAEQFGVGEIWNNVFKGNKLYNNNYDKGIVYSLQHCENKPDAGDSSDISRTNANKVVKSLRARKAHGHSVWTKGWIDAQAINGGQFDVHVNPHYQHNRQYRNGWNSGFVLPFVYFSDDYEHQYNYNNAKRVKITDYDYNLNSAFNTDI